jgi:imidazolonepropionase-like amidohydrolase
MKTKIMVIIIALVGFFLLLPEPSQENSKPIVQSIESEKKSPSENFIIRNVRFYDGNRQQRNVDISVVDFKVSKISVNLPAQSDVPEINGIGKTLLPGLIDSHTHAFQMALKEALNYGVTTELDMFTMPSFANQQQAQRDLQRNTQDADLFSATILATAPGGHGTEYGFDIPVLDSVEQVPGFVEQRIAQGADYIKAVFSSEKSKIKYSPSISREILKALIDTAHLKQRLLVVHVDDLVSAREAIELGADGIIHSFMDQVADDSFVELMVSKQAFLIPTLSVQASVAQLADGRRLLSSLSEPVFLTRQQRSQLTASFPNFGIPAQGFQNALDSVKRLSEANVVVLAGSDAPNPGTTHGLSLHGELELLVKAGLSNEQAIHSATGAVSKVFPVGSRGRLEPGQLATMILVDGNPFDRIEVTRNIVQIWKNGVALTRQTYNDKDNPMKQLSLGLITDFNHSSDDLVYQAEMGSGLAETTDQFAGGKSSVVLALEDRKNPDSTPQTTPSRHLHISGELRAGFMFPWSGVAYMLGESMQQGVDLSNVDYLVLDAKGGSQTEQISVLLFQAGSLSPLQVDVKISSTWKSYRIDLNAVDNLDRTNLTNISIVRAQSLGNFEFMIDNLKFE